MPSISYTNDPVEIQRTVTPGTIFVTQTLEHLILCFDPDNLHTKMTLVEAENMKIVRSDLNAVQHAINHIQKHYGKDYTVIYPNEYELVIHK
jgi:hypothetical protein